MAAKVTFVNKSNKTQTFKVNLFGDEKNRVKVSNLLAVFKASLAIMSDGSIVESDEDGLSMDTFKSGSMHSISIVPLPGYSHFLQSLLRLMAEGYRTNLYEV